MKKSKNFTMDKTFMLIITLEKMLTKTTNIQKSDKPKITDINPWTQ